MNLVNKMIFVGWSLYRQYYNEVFISSFEIILLCFISHKKLLIVEVDHFQVFENGQSCPMTDRYLYCCFILLIHRVSNNTKYFL